MTEGTERALEIAVAGIMFGIAFSVLLLLHSAYLKQVKVMGKAPERLILFEQKGI